MNILILYFSGVGNTKMVAQSIFNIVKKKHMGDIRSIESMDDKLDLNTYDALIICFPTIHASPAQPMMDYVKKLPPLRKAVPVFTFKTCGLYSANTLRKFAKKSIEKNIIPILNKSYRWVAIDGILIAPFLS